MALHKRQVFLSPEVARSVLRRYGRDNAYLEEMKQGNIERECVEERCNYEEAREAFENDEKTREFWIEYTAEHKTPDSDGAVSLFVVVPVATFLLLLLVGLLSLWRYRSRRLAEQSEHPSPLEHQQHRAYEHGSGLDYRLPQARGCPAVLLEAPCEGLRGLAGDGAGDRETASLGHRPSSASVASRVSNVEPPPSYEEVTGLAVTSSYVGPAGRAASPTPSGPPPAYDDIIVGDVEGSPVSSLPHDDDDGDDK
ncbi:transmembrane gamma-carboxyglutamic acid protein 3-like isoform X1 [Lethenteron reissneri]|uniref:transmembrane gamma-carboxyglutamic acid protein 3-like isoform X1 n=2 Tax=Lethenteron reissneri TaxID=7753 RepID=UPI002AB6314F|nr:transmembrane gamma-carboxyglutamic acid protein 3-like isoform X1 [Lethenteron reissneri]